MERSETRMRASLRQPAVAIVLAIMPGLPQLVAGEYAEGAVTLMAALGGAVLAWNYAASPSERLILPDLGRWDGIVAGAGITTAAALYSAIDGVCSWQGRNEGILRGLARLSENKEFLLAGNSLRTSGPINRSSLSDLFVLTWYEDKTLERGARELDQFLTAAASFQGVAAASLGTLEATLSYAELLLGADLSGFSLSDGRAPQVVLAGQLVRDGAGLRYKAAFVQAAQRRSLGTVELACTDLRHLTPFVAYVARHVFP